MWVYQIQKFIWCLVLKNKEIYPSKNNTERTHGWNQHQWGPQKAQGFHIFNDLKFKITVNLECFEFVGHRFQSHIFLLDLVEFYLKDLNLIFRNMLISPANLLNGLL